MQLGQNLSEQQHVYFVASTFPHQSLTTLSPEQLHRSWDPVCQAPHLRKPSQQRPRPLYLRPRLATASRKGTEDVFLH